MECLAVTRQERARLNGITGSSINRPMLRMAGMTKFYILETPRYHYSDYWGRGRGDDEW